MLLGVSFNSAAQDIATVTVTWDIPGSVVLYVGSTNESSKVVPPADATSYTATLDQGYGRLYARAAEGYIVTDGYCVETEDVFNYDSFSKSVRFDMYEYNGKTVHINCEKFVYDGTVTINLTSAGNVLAKFNGTSREFKLEGGEHQIPYSTKHEPTITISIPVEGAVSPYLKHNGTEISISQKYTWDTYYTHDAITLTSGDKIEVKYNDEEPVILNKYNVTLNADETALAGISMLRNYTQATSLTVANGTFQVYENDVITMTLNTADYNFEVNGVAIEPASDSNYTRWTSDPVTADTSITVTATERVYGTELVTLYVNDPLGVNVHLGSYDGELLDWSTVTPTAVDVLRGGNYYHEYKIEVSAKTPYLFVSAPEGWWFKSCVDDPELSQPTETARASATTPLYVLTQEVLRDDTLAVKVVLGTGATVDDLALKIGSLGIMELTEGYNMFFFDEEFDTNVQVQPLGISEDEDFSVYYNYSAVAVDSDSGCYNVSAANNGVLYIFVKRPSASKRTITVEMTEGAEATFSYDKVKTYTYTADANTFKVFSGAEVVVTPANGCSVAIDGEDVELTDKCYTFNPSANTTISIKGSTAAAPTAMIVTPSNGQEVELSAFEGFTVTFPNATSVEQKGAMDEITFTLGGMWSAWGFTITEVTDAEVPTFTIVPYQTPIYTGTYTLMIPEGFFVVDGDETLTNIDTFAEVKLIVSIAKEDIKYSFYPGTAKMLASETASINVIFDEGLIASIANADGITLSLGEEVIPVENYALSCEYNYLMLSDLDLLSAAGKTITLSIAEDAVEVSGNPCPAITNSWEIVEEKEYTFDVTLGSDLETLKPEDKINIYLTFVGAETAVLANENSIYNIELAQTGYPTDRYINNPEEVKEVAGENDPKYLLVFPEIGNRTNVTLMLSVYYDAFLIDDVTGNTLIEKEIGTVAGASLVIADPNVTYNVYAIDGRVVMTNGSASDVENLANGIYIINGQKVVIRK